MSKNVLNLKGLSKSYGDNDVLNSIDFSVSDIRRKTMIRLLMIILVILLFFLV